MALIFHYTLTCTLSSFSFTIIDNREQNHRNHLKTRHEQIPSPILAITSDSPGHFQNIAQHRQQRTRARM